MLEVIYFLFYSGFGLKIVLPKMQCWGDKHRVFNVHDAFKLHTQLNFHSLCEEGKNQALLHPLSTHND